MNDEREEAQYYHEHKDDEEEWGEPVAPPDVPRRGRMGATITVRFPSALAELIRATAEQSNLTYSDVVRQAVAAALRSRQEVAHKRDQDVVEKAEAVLELTRNSGAITGTAGQTRLQSNR